jgi:hypothetical protein
MFEKDPLIDDSEADRLRRQGQLRARLAIEHAAEEDRIQRELEALDASIVGISARELRRLRES